MKALKFTPIIIVLFGGIFWLFSSPSIKTPITPESIISKIPIAELAVHEFTFLVLTDAFRETDGKLFVRIASGGLLGQGEKTKMLYQAGVHLKYGVDLKNISPDRYTITGDTVNLRLPNPTVIGLPRLLTDGEYASKPIDFLPAKAQTAELEQLVRQKIQEDAKNWPQRFDLDNITRERVKCLVTAFIKTPFPDKNVTVVFDSESIENASHSSETKGENK